MRTMVLAVIALMMLTAPVWATVTIEAVQRPGELIVDINYKVEGETELVRAFALDVSVDAGVITEVNDYAVGDDNGGYGIFPANFSLFINVDPDGTVPENEWEDGDYTPVAPGTDPGALGGIDTNGVTLELGALYETQAPGAEGTLCSLTVSENCHVSLALNGMRGNVVLENAAEPGEVVLVETDIGGDCFPSSFSTYADWVRYGKPNCWCAPPEGNGLQCDGDADGNWENPFRKYRVYIQDLNVLIANWQLKDDVVGLPGGPNPCADIDHKWENPFRKYRVYIQDLNIVIKNWQVRDTDVPGLPGDCGTLARPE